VLQSTIANKVKVLELRDQLDFYFGDSNLSKDKFLRAKLQDSTLVPLDIFLEFNKVKSILGGNCGTEEKIQLLQQAVQKSKMLKLASDKKKLKRRIPFSIKDVNQDQMDAATIYVENFPEHLTHR
jgi:La-related protein 7